MHYRLYTERVYIPLIVLVIMLAMASAIIAKEPGRRYVGSKHSDKYHLPTCEWAKKIRTQNQIWFDTIAEAKAAGYRACSVCKPEGATVGAEVTPEPTEQRQEPPQAERTSQRVQSRPMGKQSRSGLSGSDNTWIYWLIGILLFLGLMAWLLRKPKKWREAGSRSIVIVSRRKRRINCWNSGTKDAGNQSIRGTGRRLAQGSVDDSRRVRSVAGIPGMFTIEYIEVLVDTSQGI